MINTENRLALFDMLLLFDGPVGRRRRTKLPILLPAKLLSYRGYTLTHTPLEQQQTLFLDETLHATLSFYSFDELSLN